MWNILQIISGILGKESKGILVLIEQINYLCSPIVMIKKDEQTPMHQPYSALHLVQRWCKILQQSSPPVYIKYFKHNKQEHASTPKTNWQTRTTFESMISFKRLSSSRAMSQFCIKISAASFSMPMTFWGMKILLYRVSSYSRFDVSLWRCVNFIRKSLVWYWH